MRDPQLEEAVLTMNELSVDDHLDSLMAIFDRYVRPSEDENHRGKGHR